MRSHIVSQSNASIILPATVPVHRSLRHPTAHPDSFSKAIAPLFLPP